MDVNLAIQFAQLVNAAYAVQPGNLNNSAGTTVTSGGVSYTVITTVYANDLSTDMFPTRSQDIVSIGLVCQADSGDVVIAIRGTEGIMEWIHDAEFGWVKCPFLAGAGHTEDGFTAMYLSLRTGADANSARLIDALPTLAWPKPATSLTICGHSLGGSIVTLLALDVAANTSFTDPTVYTYASPRTGDSSFADTYDQVVKNTFRIANRVDLVPKLPLPPFYVHVMAADPFELNPIQLLPFPPKVLVKLDIACQHVLDTYLYLLSLKAGGPVLPLDAGCVP